jgi:hypothetical protein
MGLWEPRIKYSLNFAAAVEIFSVSFFRALLYQLSTAPCQHLLARWAKGTIKKMEGKECVFVPTILFFFDRALTSWDSQVVPTSHRRTSETERQRERLCMGLFVDEYNGGWLFNHTLIYEIYVRWKQSRQGSVVIGNFIPSHKTSNIFF